MFHRAVHVMSLVADFSDSLPPIFWTFWPEVADDITLILSFLYNCLFINFNVELNSDLCLQIMNVSPINKSDVIGRIGFTSHLVL